MVVAVREQAEDVTAPKRKTSFMGRFRKNKSKSNKRDESPSPAPTDSSDEQLHVSREGVPIVTSTNASRFRASDVRPPKEERSKGHRNSVTDHVRVSAKQAAFAGPPRYDWIDIETAAAIKVQSAYRRNKVIWELEKQGKSTAKMRNRIRKRQAKQRNVAVAEDTPGCFQCCGVGLVFGDATEEDDEVVKHFERSQYHEKKKGREQEQAKLRKYRPRNKPCTKTVEGVEVVESFDE